VDGVVTEVQLHALGRQQRLLLLDHVVLRLGQDADEVLLPVAPQT